MTPKGTTIEQYGTPILELPFDSLAEKQKILFLGDLHWDHPKTNQKAIKKIMDQAVDEGAWIVLLGDTLCAMQATGDRRGDKESVRPEHQRSDYFTALIETAVEWFMPYKDNIWLVLDGNHETAVKKHHDIDLVKHFVWGLDGGSGKIQRPGYSSYALVRIHRQKQRVSAPLWLAHGHGGGGPVTKGVLQAQRRAVTYPDARVVVSGHIHSQYFVAHEQHRINNQGRTYDIAQEHYVVSAWKDEFKGGKGGWHVERGAGPVLPMGWWSEWWVTSSKESGIGWSFWQAKP